jgi:NADH-quinone oxidoreductase subunit L
MTLPLVVLAGFAAFAGFLNAEPIHIAPLGHLLEPIWERAKTVVLQREGTEPLMWTMMAPGVAAFAIGTGAAYVVYGQKRGAPETAFAQAFPRLYRLVYDKWRVDELYEVTVIGMVDALSEIFTMADKWIVDGVLAKLSAALVGALGTVARAFQTGRVQVYSASMVAGLAALGWFFVRPHAEASVDDSEVRRTGAVVFEAAPGLGYSYRWEVPGAPVKGDFSPTDDKLSVKLEPGEAKDVTLHVRNAFGQEESETYSIARPGKRGAPTPVKIPEQGGTITGDDLPNIIQPGGVVQ